MGINQKMNEIIIDLIRHGEPIGGKKYRGQTDDALSEVGWQQMAEMQMLFGEQSWQKVVSSDLKRCFNFVSQVAENKQIPLLCEADFREINFGIWGGKPLNKLSRSFHINY